MPDFAAFEEKLHRSLNEHQDLIVLDSLRPETRLAIELRAAQRESLGLVGLPRILVVDDKDEEQRFLEERVKEMLQRIELERDL